MAEVTGSPLSPSVTKGALVQLAEDFGVIVPNIIPFQYNPATVTRTLKPWDPSEVDQTNRGAQAPNVQPYDPEETYKFTLELDATDDQAAGDPLAQTTGVASRIAAIQKLTEPSGGSDVQAIKTRAAALRTAGEAQVQAHLNAQVGRTHRVLMENPNMGRTEQFSEVIFDQPQIEGQIVQARITGVRGTQLIA